MDTVFDLVKNLSFEKDDVDLEVINELYEPFLVNRAFSNNRDSLFYASEMNSRSGLPKSMQHGFYLHALVKKKRYGKWNKPKYEKGLVELIKECYNISYSKAIELIPLLEDKRDVLESYISKGGSGG